MALVREARYGSVDGVKRLLQQGVPVDVMNDDKQTALFFACENGNTEVARYLLDNGASVDLGAKPLIVAVRYNRYDCVKLLLQYHANANCTNTKGESPMSIALQKRHYSVVLLLVEYGVIPSPASLSNIAVQLLNHTEQEHAKAIQKLIDKNVINLTSESTFLAAFGFAFKHGSVGLAVRMLSNDAFPNVKQLYPDAAYYSAKNNWPGVLSELVAKKVDVNALTDGQTPLYAACKEGHESVVQLLLNNGANPNVPNKLTTSDDHSSPLQIALQRRSAMIVDMLLKKGASLNPPGEPLLHIACSSAAEWKTVGEAKETRCVEDMTSLVQLLLQLGVNVNDVSNKGDTALYRACESQQLEVVQMLLEAGADVSLKSERLYPLMAACEASNAELVSLLVKAGADVKCRNGNDETCLHTATNPPIMDSKKPADSVAIVSITKTLLEAGVDVNACDSVGETTLYRASKAGDNNIVRLLLEAGAETSGSIRYRPLYAACKHGHTQIVDLLLCHGADPDVLPASTKDHHSALRLGGLKIGAPVASSNSLPIFCAMQKGFADIVNLLVKHGADVNKQDVSGKSAFITFLELMASRRSKSSQVSNLLEESDFGILKSMLLAGGDVNMVLGSIGQNALHIASSHGMCDVMTELIQHGADCSQLTASGISALDLAYEKSHETAVELLLQNGAKPDKKNSATVNSGSRYSRYDSYEFAMPLLCKAVKSGKETMVKMLVKHGANVNESDDKGNSALHMATSITVIETLLNAGANVNVTNNNGETVLSVACEKRQADTNVVEMLLKFGADPNACFPLHSACKNNDPETVRLLLAHGANANLMKERLVNSYMRIDASHRYVKCIEPSPLCFACKNGSEDMVDCLLINGAAAAFADSYGNTPLHFAVNRLEGNTSSDEYDPIVSALLKHNPPVNEVSGEGETPLYVACKKGRAGIVKQLLDCRAAVGLTNSDSKKYPLMIACEKKFTNIATMLLDRGADANVTNDEQTPLKLASANGDVVLVKRLLSCGADVNQMQGISDTALHVVAVRPKGLGSRASVNIVQTLLKYGAVPNVLNRRGETPLFMTCKRANDVDIGIMQILLEHGADPNMCPVPCSLRPWLSDMVVLPPLTYAAICGNSELAMLLIKYGAKVNHSDDCGRTALHYAVGDDGHMYSYVQHVDVAKRMCTLTAEKLLLAGANANAKDENGESPLYLACRSGKTELVKLFLSHGANPNIGTIDTNPLHAACRDDHCDSVKLLLEYNADVTVSDSTRKTALHRALESGTYYSRNSDKIAVMVQLLLSRGANVNAVSEDGETPLYLACSKGYESVAKNLIEFGAKVDGNSGKKLPLTAACRNKHVSMVQLLLANGANPNAQEEDTHSLSLPLLIAADDDKSELVELLLKHDAKVEAVDKNGNTALHRAVDHYRPEATSSQYSKKVTFSGSAKSVVDILLENKADVNIVNSSGETPLYKATSRGLLDVVKKMLQMYGGNPNKGSLNKSPLVAACIQQNVELVDTLLKHGADPNLASTSCGRGSKYTLPLFAATDKANSDIITLLLNAGANVNAVNDVGKTVVCYAAESLISCGYYYSLESTSTKITAIRLLLEHGANLNVQMPDGRTPLHLAITALAEGQGRRRTVVVELL